MEIYLSIGVLVICFAVVTSIVARHFEKKRFNKGYCHNCKSKLSLFDTTFFGDRGYICNECGKVVWISYNVDKDFLK